MRTVLVIGAGGLIGSHVKAVFAEERVVATYHVSVPSGGMALDITDPVSVRSLGRDVRPDAVVLAAAESWVERCEREPDSTRRVNVDAARNVAESAVEVGATFVVFSSEYVFDGAKGSYAEDDPVAPVNEYGRQKVALEAIARDVPRHLICRTSGVFGWEPARQNFVCHAIDRLRAGEEFAVASDQLITPTFAPDLAKALAALIDRGATGTLHLVGPRILERIEFAAAVCRAFDLPLEGIVPRATDELGLAAPRPRRAGLSDGRLRTLLGQGLPDPVDALRRMRQSEAAPRRR